MVDQEDSESLAHSLVALSKMGKHDATRWFLAFGVYISTLGESVHLAASLTTTEGHFPSYAECVDAIRNEATSRHVRVSHATAVAMTSVTEVSETDATQFFARGPSDV